jgi:formylglycine-generating enzyme required for sulfatase activity
MRKLLVLIFWVLAVGELFADISVKSFRKLESDMTARIDAPKLDQNGKTCAIIKVVTTQKDFVWETDALGIVAAEQKVGEYWLYIPWGAKRLTIKHAQLGVLRDYLYPMTIEQATVYELVLTTGRVTTIVEETIESQWLVITPEPSEALIYINDEFVKTGEYQSKLKPGTYNYRVELPLYHTEAGRVEMGSEKKTLAIKLKPAFGYIKVTSQPENGAQVFVNGKLLTATTPLTTEPIASGEHTVQVVKEMYQPAVQKVMVTDGQTTPLNVTLQPNFAELEIKSPTGAKIFVNSQQKGTGNWSGRLSAGVYSLEAQLDKHRPAKQDIEVVAGDKRTIDLQPTPIYGSLDVVTSPSGATIKIDGKEYGTTPNTINRLLIGDYSVELTRLGYANVIKGVTISEGKSTTINETLVNGREVTINSTPSEANLYIDGNAVGKTPFIGSLTFGSHMLKIESEGKTATRTVNVAQSGGETNFTIAFGVVTFVEIVNGIRFQMIAVEGGIFQMGNNDVESDEKPVHSVTLSDFSMSKTEVTQELWTAVMGNNPSNLKGNNFPVDQVSWNDCQEFIKKLNQLTEKNYRLPTEAEWEYAAGGGATNRTKWAGTNSESNLGIYAWNSSNSGSKTHEVATKRPNALGLYDMSGNVWEWCSDWYGNFSSSSQINPKGVSSGLGRVGRGGSWDSGIHDCRSAYRILISPDRRNFDLGFRLVFVP